MQMSRPLSALKSKLKSLPEATARLNSPPPLPHNGTPDFSNRNVLYAQTDLLQSDAPAAEETRLNPKNAAVEQAKSFISGGFGGVSAVLVGSFIICQADNWGNTDGSAMYAQVIHSI